MIKNAKEYDDEQLENKKDETQDENWIEQGEVQKILMYPGEANKLFLIKGRLSIDNTTTLNL